MPKLLRGASYGRGAFKRTAMGFTGEQYGAGFSLPAGLIFYYDPTIKSMYARYSLGDPRVSLSCARSTTSPATYIDASGVIRIESSSNVPRYTYNKYALWLNDALAVPSSPNRPEIMSEPARTNMITYTDGKVYGGNTWPGWSYYNMGTWTATLVDASELFPGCMAQRFQYTGVASDKDLDTTFFKTAVSYYGSVTAGSIAICSFYYKSSSINFAPKVYIVNCSSGAELNNNGFVLAQNTSGKWQRAVVYAPIAAGTTDCVRASFQTLRGTSSGILPGTMVDFQIALMQIETGGESSYIPTQATAVTRRAEVITFQNGKNRNSEVESVHGRFTVGFYIARTASAWFLSTEGDQRFSRKLNANQYADILANGASSPLCAAYNMFMGGLSCQVAGIVMSHTVPYISSYDNGTIEGKELADDFIDPDMGDRSFYGCSPGQTQQLNGSLGPLVIFKNRQNGVAASEVYKTIR